MLVQEPVNAAIWHCLNHYDYKDAIFLAERLFCEVHSDESLHLLATCYFRAGKIGQAYELLQANGPRTPQCKFLMAKCCQELNKMAEAEAVLLGDDSNMSTGGSSKLAIEEIASGFGDAAGFALQILARIYATTERTTKGIDADKAALYVNPFLWSSFESLCNTNCSTIDPHKLFNVDHLKNFSHCHGVNSILSYANNVVAKIGGQNIQPAQNPSTNQYTNTHANQNVRHGSATSTPILPAVNPASLAPTNVLKNQTTQLQSNVPPKQAAIVSSQTTVQNNNTQPHNLMTTMMTPVNQFILDSTIGDLSGVGNDSCFTR